MLCVLGIESFHAEENFLALLYPFRTAGRLLAAILVGLRRHNSDHHRILVDRLPK